jgi:hypothetical protein
MPDEWIASERRWHDADEREQKHNSGEEANSAHGVKVLNGRQCHFLRLSQTASSSGKSAISNAREQQPIPTKSKRNRPNGFPGLTPLRLHCNYGAYATSPHGRPGEERAG